MSDRITLSDLHGVIQDALGWQDCHLHEFTIDGVQYGDPATDEYGEFDLRDDAETRLWRLGLGEGHRFAYLYDFGDDWQHSLLVEKILAAGKKTGLPRCLDGERACPPEDVGGVGGYAEFLEALGDPSDPEHASYLEWVGGAFDAELFDLEAANQRMRRRSLRSRAGPWALPLEEERSPAEGMLDPSQPAAAATAELEQTARDLPLRRDMETFLVYLGNHKVTGTQSSGNLPLKAVAQVSAGFLHPPVLERTIGGHAFRFRSEEDVWPLYFTHLLANGAELVSGGPGRRWRLTPQGERFLSAPALTQLRVLLAAWWYRVNWLVALAWNIFGEALPPQVRQAVLSLLGGYSTGERVEFEPFVDRLIEEVGWTWNVQEPDYTRGRIASSVEGMVIDPLAELGVLSTQYVKAPESTRVRDLEELASFSLTDLGRTLLHALR